MTEDSLFLIDVDRILQEKAPKYYKFIPKFIISYLKQIAHQNELNEFLKEVEGTEGVEFLKECVSFLDMDLHVEGLGDISNDKLYTFVSNHPLGGQDGVALGYIIGKKFEGQVKYLVNDLLMDLQGLAPLCIPINKTGQQSRDFPKMVEAGFMSNNQLIMFPAGLCSRRIAGKIQDLPWSKTFITKSVQTKRDVVPIHFEGRNSDFFYNLSDLCRILGIKFNVAMLYLADEMIKNRHKSFRVIFGKPIPWQTFDDSKKPQEWAQEVRNIVYQLK